MDNLRLFGKPLKEVADDLPKAFAYQFGFTVVAFIVSAIEGKASLVLLGANLPGMWAYYTLSLYYFSQSEVDDRRLGLKLFPLGAIAMIESTASSVIVVLFSSISRLEAGIPIWLGMSLIVIGLGFLLFWVNFYFATLKIKVPPREARVDEEAN
mmetsp:Transcript_32812/g.50104  ORF Transcript_32812/g.50104 Transcript_32812/m.50104 type:complete len:154 (+) Transcript_32812:2-463(+)